MRRPGSGLGVWGGGRVGEGKGEGEGVCDCLRDGFCGVERWERWGEIEGAGWGDGMGGGEDAGEGEEGEGGYYVYHFCVDGQWILDGGGVVGMGVFVLEWNCVFNQDVNGGVNVSTRHIAFVNILAVSAQFLL